MQKKDTFDIIIIGSGIGSLTVASLMAKVKKNKVLLLEQHSRIGGYTHSFSRKGFTWDTGLHYIGDIFDGKLTGLVFNFISGGKLHWYKTPDPFEHFVYPDFTFRMHGDEKRFRNDLLALYPEETKAIRRYFLHIKIAVLWFVVYFLCQCLPAIFRLPLSLVTAISGKLALMTTGAYLDRYFKSPELKSLLTSQWGNYGLTPSRSSFMIHGLIVNHFMQGGYYPEGGAGEIARRILPAVTANGGQYLVNRTVTSLIIENGKAAGVEVVTSGRDGSTPERYYAPVIVSGAGAYNTFTRLVPEGIPLPFMEKCAGINTPTSCVALYIGFKDDIRKLGFTEANYWFYGSYNHEDNSSNHTLLEGKKPASCFLSFTPPDRETGQVTTATVIAFAEFRSFTSWNHQKTGKRDKEYYSLKKRISKGLIDFLEERHPGFSAMIGYHELGTPLSAQEFTASHEGGMYGLPATPQRYRQKWLTAKTPVKGLYLTGSDITSLGVVPSMLSGLVTASQLCGPLGFFRLVGYMRRKGGVPKRPAA